MRATHFLNFGPREGKAQRGETHESKDWVLPEDVLVEVARHLTLPEDVLSFSLASTHLHAALLSVLYSTLDLKSTHRCLLVLAHLASHPTLSRTVQHLVLRLDHGRVRALPADFRQPMHPHSLSLDEDEESILDDGCHQCIDTTVARVLCKCARVGALDGLRTLIWDGLEMPPDVVWVVLRASCPQLRTIGTSVGRVVDPESNLFSFVDLRGFILYDKESVYPPNVILPAPKPLPPRLIAMLRAHSPDLRALVIDGTPMQYRVYDPAPLRQLLGGRDANEGGETWVSKWDKLEKFTLGVLYRGAFASGVAVGINILEEQAWLSDFLENHARTLKSLTLRDVPPGLMAISPPQPPSESFFPRYFQLTPTITFPALISYTGQLAYSSDLACFPALAELQLECAAERNIGRLAEALRGLCNQPIPLGTVCERGGVKALNLTLDTKGRDGMNHPLEKILESCVGLRHLMFTCKLRSAYFMEDFTSALRYAPHLESFALTKRHDPREDVSTAAIELAQTHGRVRAFWIETAVPASEVPAGVLNGLGEIFHGGLSEMLQGGFAGAWARATRRGAGYGEKARTESVSAYLISRDNEGAVVTIRGEEWRRGRETRRWKWTYAETKSGDVKQRIGVVGRTVKGKIFTRTKADDEIHSIAHRMAVETPFETNEEQKIWLP